MSDPFIGQIVPFAGTFAPRGWALCDGQLLPIASYQALFSIVGTTYGGDARTTFALPDLRGRVPVHPDPASGLLLGQARGAEEVRLEERNLPPHTHGLRATNTPGGSHPGNAVPAMATAPVYSSSAATVELNATTLSTSGSNLPLQLVQPSQAVHYIIALTGVYPPRS